MHKILRVIVAIAFVLALIVFINVLMAGLGRVAGIFGIPLYSEHQSDGSSSVTWTGLVAVAFSITPIQWACNAMETGSWRVGLTKRGWFWVLIWFVALFILAVVFAFIHLAFEKEISPRAEFLSMISHLAAIGVVWFVGREVWKKIIKKQDEKNKDEG